MPKFSITAKVSEINTDYLVTLDGAGNYVSAWPVILDLPESAQKLILGSSDEEQAVKKRKILAYGQLIEYIIMLRVNDKLPDLGDTYIPLIQFLKSVSFKKDMDDFLSEAEYLIDEVLQSKNVSSEFIENLILRHYDQFLVFFSAIVPLMRSSAQSVAFRTLQMKNVESLEAFLLEELEFPYSTPYAGGILKALSKLKQPSRKVLGSTIDLYHREGAKSEEVYAGICDVMAFSSTVASKEICLEVLKRNKPHSASSAAGALLLTHHSPQEVKDIIEPYFLMADPKISEVAFSVFCYNGMTKKYLPSPEVVMDTYIKMVEKGKANNFEYLILSIAIKVKLYKKEGPFLRALKHENTRVISSTLALINGLLRTTQSMKWLNKKWVMEQLEKLAKLQDNDVAKKITWVVCLIGRRNKNPDCLDILLHILDRHKKNEALLSDCLRKIAELFSDLAYQSKVELTLAKYLESENQNVLKYAIHSLLKTKNLELKQRLIKFKDHPHDDIKKAVAGLNIK